MNGSDHPRHYVTTANKVFFKLVLDCRYFLLQGGKGLCISSFGLSPYEAVMVCLCYRLGSRGLILARQDIALRHLFSNGSPWSNGYQD